jgi:hypothetical protein
MNISVMDINALPFHEISQSNQFIKLSSSVLIKVKYLVQTVIFI